MNKIVALSRRFQAIARGRAGSAIVIVFMWPTEPQPRPATGRKARRPRPPFRNIPTRQPWLPGLGDDGED